ncbi:hypothetical protein PMI23_02099 [Pseudomonas sp. GM24]|nr:hypothetical protein PMI19_00648 [Pseudomonas sp. GM16]EJM40326.1 hypothetical protein PMI23_02099 [Pseudomonas sp. GM24]
MLHTSVGERYFLSGECLIKHRKLRQAGMVELPVPVRTIYGWHFQYGARLWPTPGLGQNRSIARKFCSRTTSFGLYAQYPGRGPIFG